MQFVFDLPLLVTGPILIGLLVGLSLLGLHWFRRHQLPRLRFGEGDVEFSAAMLASIMVFYGLAAALTAVQTWEVYDNVKGITEREASSLAVLYRNVGEYPEPIRSELRQEIRAYTEQLIHESWPLQKRGEIPTETIKTMDQLQHTIFSFEPVTEAQKALALETVSSFSRMMEARRMRLDSIYRRLPGVIWLVIVLGAFISLVSSYYFPVKDERVHRVQVGLLAAFIGLVVFITLALDRPFDGDLGLTAEPYQIVYEQLMKP